MATPATHLAKIDAAIDEILTAMADVEATQVVKIRGREVTRASLEARLNALVSARGKLAAVASRESRGSTTVGRLGYPSY